MSEFDKIGDEPTSKQEIAKKSEFLADSGESKNGEKIAPDSTENPATVPEKATRKNRRIGSKTAFNVARVGMMAGTVECGKLALAFLPNIEVVTLLLALFGYVFGWLGVACAFVFVCIEPLLWGVNTWVVSYFLYWPLIPFVFCLFAKFKVKNVWIFTGVAVLLTVWFGVLTSLVDVGLLSGYFDRFFYRFSIYYMRGIPFYITHVACNAVVFPLLFNPIKKLLEKSNKI